MRKMLLLAVLAFAATLTAAAQEYPSGRFERRDSTRIAEPFVLPDTIVHMTPWMPSYDVMAPIGSKPVVSMTSWCWLPNRSCRPGSPSLTPRPASWSAT